MKLHWRLNNWINAALKPLGLMVTFDLECWWRVGVCRRPKIAMFGGAPRVIYEDAD